MACLSFHSFISSQYLPIVNNRFQSSVLDSVLARWRETKNQGGRGEIGDEGFVCRKRQCQYNDVDCLLNKTNTISWQYVALPKISYLPQPMTLINVRTLGYSVFPNLRFHITDGNREGLFDVIKFGDRGEVRLLHPINGPEIYSLRLQMDNRNNANYVVSSHIAFIEVHVSEWTF